MQSPAGVRPALVSTRSHLSLRGERVGRGLCMALVPAASFWDFYPEEINARTRLCLRWQKTSNSLSLQGLMRNCGHVLLVECGHGVVQRVVVRPCRERNVGYRTACVYSGGFKKKPVWLCWALVTARGILCCGTQDLFLAAHGLSCPTACGILVP